MSTDYFTELALAVGLTAVVVLVVILPIEYAYEHRRRAKSIAGGVYRTVVAVFDRPFSALNPSGQFAGAMNGDSNGVPYRWDLEALPRLSWLQLGWLDDQIFLMRRKERGSPVLVVRAKVRQDVSATDDSKLEISIGDQSGHVTTPAILSVDAPDITIRLDELSPPEEGWTMHLKVVRGEEGAKPA